MSPTRNYSALLVLALTVTAAQFPAALAQGVAEDSVPANSAPSGVSPQPPMFANHCPDRVALGLASGALGFLAGAFSVVLAGFLVKFWVTKWVRQEVGFMAANQSAVPKKEVA